jgi:hypothetical protein
MNTSRFPHCVLEGRRGIDEDVPDWFSHGEHCFRWSFESVSKAKVKDLEWALPWEIEGMDVERSAQCFDELPDTKTTSCPSLWSSVPLLTSTETQNQTRFPDSASQSNTTVDLFVTDESRTKRHHRTRQKQDTTKAAKRQDTDTDTHISIYKSSHISRKNPVIHKLPTHPETTHISINMFTFRERGGACP